MIDLAVHLAAMTDHFNLKFSCSISICRVSLNSKEVYPLPFGGKGRGEHCLYLPPLSQPLDQEWMMQIDCYSNWWTVHIVNGEQ
jgi:hypothetical protein